MSQIPLDVPQSLPRAVGGRKPPRIDDQAGERAGCRVGARSRNLADSLLAVDVTQGVGRTPSARSAHRFEDACTRGAAHRPAPGIRRSCAE